MPNTTNFNWTTPADTDLVKDGALAIRTLANGIDTSLVDLKGGTTGQVLSKATNTDLDFTWVAQDDSNAIQNAIIDAKGDLIVGTAADTPARLAVGETNGHVLKVDSSTASGLAWGALPSAAPASANNYVSTAQTTSSNSYTALTTAQSVTLTTGTKVLVLIGMDGVNDTNGYGYVMSYSVSGATSISVSDAWAAGLERSPGNEYKGFHTRHSFQTVTAGSNTFTALFRRGYEGGTATFANRYITVIDLGS